MKTPRVEDFDPNAVPALSSPLDDYPRIEKPKSTVSVSQTPPVVSLSPAVAVPAEPSVRTNQRSFERSNERTKIRHTFDIFQDQLISLRELALRREATFGKRTLLGDLVQEALDMFITKERNTE